MIHDSCWYCKHFWLSTGEADWSDVTLGSDGGVGCYKGNFDLAWKSGVSEREVYEALAKARTCPDFEARDLSFLE